MNKIDNTNFSLRLAKLRSEKGVSARDMSLSLGQNAGYINNIENGKALPSMTLFFYICDYLEISPSEFFDTEVENPKQLDVLMDFLKKLSPNQIDTITNLVRDITH